MAGKQFGFYLFRKMYLIYSSIIVSLYSRGFNSVVLLCFTVYAFCFLLVLKVFSVVLGGCVYCFQLCMFFLGDQHQWGYAVQQCFLLGWS